MLLKKSGRGTCPLQLVSDGIDRAFVFDTQCFPYHAIPTIYGCLLPLFGCQFMRSVHVSGVQLRSRLLKDTY